MQHLDSQIGSFENEVHVNVHTKNKQMRVRAILVYWLIDGEKVKAVYLRWVLPSVFGVANIQTSYFAPYLHVGQSVLQNTMHVQI